MASCTAKIEETSSGEDDDRVSIWEFVGVNLWLDISFDNSFPCHETGHVNFVVEMSDVSNDGVVLHL